MHKVNFCQLDKFLRRALTIGDDVTIKIASNKEHSWKNILGGPKVLGVFVIHREFTTKSFYVIYRHDLKGQKLIETICHEYVHVYQVSSKKWILNADYQIWNGKRINLSLDQLRLKEFKFTSPWEVQAYELEVLLAKKFVEEKCEISRGRDIFNSLVKFFLLEIFPRKITKK